MMRFVLILFGAIIAITLLRSSLGLLAKGLQMVMNPPPQQQPRDPNTVEMVKCPSCGSVFAPHQHVKKG
jgi:hypothetical protein